MGPEEATESLRTVLALGVDRAVLVERSGGRRLRSRSSPAGCWPPSSSGSTPTSCCSASRPPTVSAEWCGRRWPSACGLPFVSQVTELTVDGGTVRATRQTELGDDVVEVALPAVVSVSDAINEPRYSSLKGKMAAKKKPLDIADPRRPRDRRRRRRCGRLGHRRARASATRRPGPTRSRSKTTATAAQAILDYLVERRAGMKTPRVPRAPRATSSTGSLGVLTKAATLGTGDVAAVLVGRATSRRRSPPRRAATAPPRVHVADDGAFETPLPQPHRRPRAARP